MKSVTRLFVVVVLAAASVPAFADRSDNDVGDVPESAMTAQSGTTAADRNADEQRAIESQKSAADDQVGAASGEPKDATIRAPELYPRDFYGNAPWERYAP